RGVYHHPRRATATRNTGKNPSQNRSSWTGSASPKRSTTSDTAAGTCWKPGVVRAIWSPTRGETPPTRGTRSECLQHSKASLHTPQVRARNCLVLSRPLRYKFLISPRVGFASLQKQDRFPVAAWGCSLSL